MHQYPIAAGIFACVICMITLPLRLQGYFNAGIWVLLALGVYFAYKESTKHSKK